MFVMVVGDEVLWFVKYEEGYDIGGELGEFFFYLEGFMVGWEEGELVDEEGDEVVDVGFLEGFEVGDVLVSVVEGFVEGFVVFGGYGGEE